MNQQGSATDDDSQVYLHFGSVIHFWWFFKGFLFYAVLYSVRLVCRTAEIRALQSY